MSRLTIITMTLLSMTFSPSFAADAPHFEREIAPLLKRHCVKCHGPVKQEGKLNVSSPSGLIRGGETGAALVPHDVEASLLWKRIASDEMPPDAPLSADEKSLFKRWIVAGTPGLARDAKVVDASDHWAFRKLTRLNVSESPRLVPSPPSSGERARVRGPNGENASPNTNGSRSSTSPNTKPLESNGTPHPNPLPPKSEGEGTGTLDSRLTPLDSFIVADLARDGLTLSPEADRATQIRRVSFDLTGLPPTPDAIFEFVHDVRPDAYERMVDRTLASPHYGERCGKLWLDAAGYADSNGYFNADSDRPLAYRYRDYVVRAINSDKPFDQFVREQFAGDEIARVMTANSVMARNGETAILPVPSPPSSGERARVRGPNGENASPNTNGSPSSTSPNTKSLDSNGPPHSNPLPPKSGGEGTGRKPNEVAVSSPSTLDLHPSTLLDLLEATHYLRNGQDGTGESDGNPDEIQIDRYTVIETTMQNISTGLLGLTIQCAKCHDHKFEPLTQRDYASLQAVLIPAFPPEQWVKPNDRFVYACLPGEVEAWQAKLLHAETTVLRLQSEIGEWVKQHRPRGTILFADGFDAPPESLAERWSNTAPGDDVPGGTVAVNLNSREAPGAIVVDGKLQLMEGGPGGDKWLSTKLPFDWTPDTVGAAIQVTFDLVEHHVGDSKPSDRIGYFIALHDFNDNGSTPGGNILIDGHPTSSTAVHPDYPGKDSTQAGVIGTTGYQPGRNYGVRITNKGKSKFVMEHLVDWQVEEKSITFQEADLPAGGFGFEFCCDRSFIIDNVAIESFAPTDGKNPLTEFLAELKAKRQPLDEAMKSKTALTAAKPGKIAWTTDLIDQPPQTHVFLRGNYHTPGDAVEPRGFAVLSIPPVPSPPSSGERARVRGPDSENAQSNTRDSTSSSSPNTVPLDSTVPPHPHPLPPKTGGEGTRQGDLARGTGRRLDFANWITQPDSAASALLARVHVNRLWQHHFGVGIVSTPDNFGVSGSPPSHPELLDWLASEFIRSGWSTKHVTKLIVNSAAYRQSSVLAENGTFISEGSPLVPSPPSSGERARVRGPNSENASPNTNDLPISTFPNIKPLDSNGPPHSNPLPPKSGGEGTRQHDPDARRLSRFPVRRLDAEAIRDALLFASGDFDDQMFGPYIATSRTGVGETVVPEDQPGARRRSIYLQHKRTQVHSLLQVFDAPSIVFNSTRRPRSTMPLQSLSQLNSEFSVARGYGLASRLWQMERAASSNDSDRLTHAFVLAQGHTPTDEQVATTMRFLAEQTAEYSNQTSASPTDTNTARQRAWSDLCQMLLIGNAALYLD